MDAVVDAADSALDDLCRYCGHETPLAKSNPALSGEIRQLAKKLISRLPFLEPDTPVAFVTQNDRPWLRYRWSSSKGEGLSLTVDSTLLFRGLTGKWKVIHESATLADAEDFMSRREGQWQERFFGLESLSAASVWKDEHHVHDESGGD